LASQPGGHQVYRCGREGAVERFCLRNISDPGNARRYVDRPVRQRDQSKNGPDERGLSSAIRAHDGHELSRCHVKRDIIEDASSAERDGNVVNVQHSPWYQFACGVENERLVCLEAVPCLIKEHEFQSLI